MSHSFVSLHALRQLSLLSPPHNADTASGAARFARGSIDHKGSIMAEMNVWQKLDKAEQSLRTGDFNGLKEASVISGEGQFQFMQTLKDRLENGKAGLPDLQIVDQDKDGSPEKIKVGSLTIQKDGKGLSVETSSMATRMRESLSNSWDSLKKAVGETLDMGTDLNDALKRANTSDSELNRRWARQVKQAGG
jgi:hypothetical protein